MTGKRWAALAVLAVEIARLNVAQASTLHCRMRGRDIQPRTFVAVLDVEAATGRIVRVEGEEVAGGGWSQKVSGAEFQLTKLGPGQQYSGGDGRPYWEWRINRATGKARHSVWVALHGTRSHWAGRCSVHLK